MIINKVSANTYQNFRGHDSETNMTRKQKNTAQEAGSETARNRLWILTLQRFRSP